ICRHGCSKELLTDRDTHFVNKMLDSLCDQLEVKHRLSIAYHPQTNGLVKHYNRILYETLAKFANQNKDDWDLYIPSALFAYRVKRHSTTRHEPFYLMYGRDATLPIEFAIPTMQAEVTKTDEQEDLLSRIQRLTGKVVEDRLVTQDLIHKAQEKVKLRHDDQI